MYMYIVYMYVYSVGPTSKEWPAGMEGEGGGLAIVSDRSRGKTPVTEGRLSGGTLGGSGGGCLRSLNFSVIFW